MQSVLVSNQHVIFALQPAARSRLNTVFMTGMFLGGAFASAVAMLAWNHAGWGGLCACGSGLVLLGLAVEPVGHRRSATAALSGNVL